MNKRQQQAFVSFFEQVQETEQALDVVKSQLARCASFNPNALFDAIANGAETITIVNMRQYLVNRLPCNQRELYEIFQRFDWSRRGQISRQDFLREIAVHTPLINTLTSTLQAESQSMFVALLSEILRRFRITQVARKQVAPIAPYEAFGHIDYQRIGIIGIDELYKLFTSNDFVLNDQQIGQLLHGLKRRCYRQVNLEVFCENLQPLQFGHYANYGRRLEQDQEQDILSRSRKEQETIRRERQRHQRLEHEVQKAERKKQADVERQLQLEERIQGEIVAHEIGKERLIRKALLEEDRLIRHQTLGEQLAISEERRAVEREYDKRCLDKLASGKENYKQLQDQLAHSRDIRSIELENSRRDNEMYYRAREAELIQRSLPIRYPVSSVDRETELELSRMRLAAIEESRLRVAAEQSRRRVIAMERMNYEDHLREVQGSRRIAEYEKELERTRLEIQQRRSRLRQSYSTLSPEATTPISNSVGIRRY